MAQTTRLTSFGPVFVVPAQSITYLVIRAYIYSKNFVSIEKKRRKMEKKKHLWPKTTSDASFGLVFIVPAQYIMYLVIRTYIYNRTFVSIKKEKEGKRKKNHLWLVMGTGNPGVFPE